MDLFEHSRKKQMEREAPLAARMRPRRIEDFVGQEHILGEGRLLRRAIGADRLFSSLVFWGPPGVGKTTLATIIANTTRSHFDTLSAVMAGVADIRRVVQEARERWIMDGRRTILLVDEIHRFNRAQQDALLPHVEDGTIVLIGATTENPYFAINGPLLSRSRVFQFQPLQLEQIVTLLERALADEERGYGQRQVSASSEALLHLARITGGDVRAAYNALELAVESTPPHEDGQIELTLEVAEDSVQQRRLPYDQGGDEHYDTISALIKAIRGSDPDAALYWLARMVLSGEDPRFLFRRLFILASEDVGLADPLAVMVVDSCARAFEWVGMPEGQYHLSQATLYLACAAKSNSTGAFFAAKEALEREGAAPVPPHLRDKAQHLAPSLRQHYQQTVGPHAPYLYPHDYPTGWVDQPYLPQGVSGGWFQPKGHGYEQKIIDRLAYLRQNPPDGNDNDSTPR